MSPENAAIDRLISSLSDAQSNALWEVLCSEPDKADTTLEDWQGYLRKANII